MANFNVVRLVILIALVCFNGHNGDEALLRNITTELASGEYEAQEPLGTVLRAVRWLTALENNIYHIKEDDSIFFHNDNGQISKMQQRKGRTTALQGDPTNELRCYGVYGCFSIARPWTSSIRPINVFPEPPEVVNPRFCLLTRRNPDTCQLLKIGDSQSVHQSNIQSKRPVFFVTHGYLENGNKKWIQVTS